MLTKISKLTFKGEVNYHATAHHSKMESRMKGQGSRVVVKELKKDRSTIDVY